MSATSRAGVHSGHGTPFRSCPEPACVQHRARYAKRWAFERAHGRLRLTDSRPTVLHLASLRGAGWSLRAIAGEAEVSPSTVSSLMSGQRTTVKRTVEMRILALDPGSVPSRPSAGVGEPFVSRVGTVRRIQALLAIGWTHDLMLAHSGCRTAVLLNQRGRWVSRSTHVAVARMYRELSRKAGPSERTRTRARRLGYPSPAAWENIDADEAPQDDGLPTAS